jgi:glycosyltransferase involved in cell wall biosynthesis
VTRNGGKEISVFIPAFNEETRLRQTVETVFECARKEEIGIDVIIVDDASSDRTAEVAADLARQYRLRVIRHSENKGFGYGFQEAARESRCEKILLFPGDNCVSAETLRAMMRNAWEADFVGANLANTTVRPLLRRVLSKIHSTIYIVTFRLPLTQIQLTPVYTVDFLRSTQITSPRYSFLPEAAVRMIRKGVSFREITGYMNEEATRSSSALRLKNLRDVVRTYLWLVWEIYFQGDRNN